MSLTLAIHSLKHVSVKWKKWLFLFYLIGRPILYAVFVHIILVDFSETKLKIIPATQKKNQNIELISLV